ncbi:hypothetical protein B296_00016950 [Ensete ventricosum]|uniref:Uncharacterized protein n=1 Tax=Ensete ventricosum TaxID=4639 RepID=A0A427B353_ENSVE|nr:hypothetical protein B296_00016950 [Ensete ventricosum]
MRSSNHVVHFPHVASGTGRDFPFPTPGGIAAPNGVSRLRGDSVGGAPHHFRGASCVLRADLVCGWLRRPMKRLSVAGHFPINNDPRGGCRFCSQRSQAERSPVFGSEEEGEGEARLSRKMFVEKFKVESPNVRYGEEEIDAVYHYETTELVHESRDGVYHWIVKPKTVRYNFKTDTRVPKLGYLCSFTHPDDIVFGGWDISDMNLADAMARAMVLDIDLQKQLRPYMESMVPLPGIFDPDFVAANQSGRANSVIKGTKKEQKTKTDKVVVLWTANTERYSDVIVGLNDTMENLMASLEKNEAEISPSTLSCMKSFGGWLCEYLTYSILYLYAGLIEMAIQRNTLIGGDDFKSGQTKMKSVLVDFLVGAGIKVSDLGSSWHTSGECPLQAESHAGEHSQGLHRLGSREQHEPRVQVKSASRNGS